MRSLKTLLVLFLVGGTAYGVKQINTADIANLAITNAKIAASTIDLTAKVTNTLPKANGGTGQTTALAAFQDFYESVATTLGDMIYGGASGAPTRLAGNTTSTKKFYTQTGTGTVSAAPGWNTIAGSDLPNPSASTLGGVESYAAVTHQWINAISTSGVPSSTQPAFSDVSGTATAAQLPAPATGSFTTNIDWSVGKNLDYLYTLTLSANTTITWSNVAAGQTIVVAITNTASNYTVTWPAAAKWPAATAPTETIGAHIDVITCKSYDGTNAYCSAVQNY